MTKKATKPVEAPPEEGVEITPEEAQRVLQEKRNERIQLVEKGIQDLCNAHRCVLDVQITLSMFSKPEGRIVVLPRD